MKLGVFLTAIFISPCVYCIMNYLRNAKGSKMKMTDDDFTITVPDFAMYLGILGNVACAFIVLLFTLNSDELPHPIFYIVFSMFFILYTYLILKTINFKVRVKDDCVTVRTILSKNYTFKFCDIISVERQVKKNKINSERIVIRTSSRKKLIIENSEISYERMRRRLETDVENELLTGF